MSNDWGELERRLTLCEERVTRLERHGRDLLVKLREIAIILIGHVEDRLGWERSILPRSRRSKEP